MLKEYNEHGYYICKDLLSQSDVENALDTVRNSFGEGSSFDCMKSVYDDDINKYKSTVSLLAKLLPVHNLLYSDGVISCLTDIGITNPVIPTSPVIHLMSSGLKLPGGYLGLVPHQDWTSMQGSLDAVIVWIPLVDIDKDFYPLEVLPGSHKRGLLDGKIGANYYETDSSLYRDEDFVPVEVNRGDVVFISCWTVHRSSLNGPDDDVRLGCSIRYENADEPTFIERGYPSAYTRGVNREMITSDFPSKEQVNNIFTLKHEDI